MEVVAKWLKLLFLPVPTGENAGARARWPYHGEHRAKQRKGGNVSAGSKNGERSRPRMCSWATTLVVISFRNLRTGTRANCR